MVESNTEAARPARRRVRRPQASIQKQATDSLFKGLDRFGLAPVLLLALAYVGHSQVVQPIANAYAKMVADVDENNKLLKESVERNNQEDSVRVQSISAAQAENKALLEENKALNKQILEVVANSESVRKQIQADAQRILERVDQLINKVKDVSGQ